MLASLASSLLVDATAIAHDAPGFGLTQEPEKGEDALYGFASNAKLGTALVAQVEGEERGEGVEIMPVFVGHSMGAISSSFMALDRIKRLEGKGGSSPTSFNPKVTLILVSPAILPSTRRQSTPAQLPPAARPFLGVSVPRFGRCLWQTLGLHKVALVSLRYFLRSLAYSKDFWQRGLRLAWGQRQEGAGKGGPGDRTLAHYRLPSLKKGWDRSLARFVLAPLNQKPPEEEGEGEGVDGQQGMMRYGTLVQGLAERVADGSLRLLLVHGQEDRVVGVANTRRLHAAMPGAALWELPAIGHVPHEETPEAFAQEIAEWISCS